MNKFAIGDVVYFPQNTILLGRPNVDVSYVIINKPSIGIYIGNKHHFCGFDIYGEVLWAHEDNLDKLNLYLEREKNIHAN